MKQDAMPSPVLQCGWAMASSRSTSGYGIAGKRNTPIEPLTAIIVVENDAYMPDTARDGCRPSLRTNLDMFSMYLARDAMSPSGSAVIRSPEGWVSLLCATVRPETTINIEGPRRWLVIWSTRCVGRVVSGQKRHRPGPNETNDPGPAAHVAASSGQPNR